MKDKQQALSDWLDMIHKSWTWAKLTEEERERFTVVVTKSITQKEVIRGTYRQRWCTLNGLYNAFLEGCGYMPIGWREEGIVMKNVSLTIKTAKPCKDQEEFNKRYKVQIENYKKLLEETKNG